MSRPTVVVARKTLRDFSSLKLLAAFYVPYVGITLLAANGLLPDVDDMASLTLSTQEQILTETFSQLAVNWAGSLPAMVLVGVLVAEGIVKDEQEGSLRILLSKPVRRRQVLAGKVLAVVAFGTLAVTAGLLVAASAVYTYSDASSLALGGSVLALLPGAVVYATFVIVLVASVGTFFAVLTGSRLKTALATLLVPALFFGFLFVRLVTGGSGVYTRYKLFLFDVNYHFGNAFVLLQHSFGVEFAPLTQAGLGRQTGVYDVAAWGPDPLVGGFAATVPLSGYVPAVASFGLLLAGATVLLALAVRWFQRKDIS